MNPSYPLPPLFFSKPFFFWTGDDADEGYVGVELPEYACKCKSSDRRVVDWLNLLYIQISLWWYTVLRRLVLQKFHWLYLVPHYYLHHLFWYAAFHTVTFKSMPTFLPYIPLYFRIIFSHSSIPCSLFKVIESNPVYPLFNCNLILYFRIKPPHYLFDIKRFLLWFKRSMLCCKMRWLWKMVLQRQRQHVSFPCHSTFGKNKKIENVLTGISTISLLCILWNTDTSTVATCHLFSSRFFFTSLCHFLFLPYHWLSHYLVLFSAK